MTKGRDAVEKKGAGGLFTCFFILLVLSIPAYFLSPANFELMDLPEFYTPAKMILSGHGSSIYDVPSLKAAEKALFPWMKAESIVLYLPPFAVPWLVPSGFVPEAAIGPVWWLSLLISTVGALALLRNCFGLSERALLWTGTILSAFGPEWESIKHGQLAPFLLLSLSLAIWALKRDHPRLCAGAFSFLLLKPHLLLPFLAYLTGARRYRPILYLALPAALLIGLSLLMVGPAGYKDYQALMSYSFVHRQWMAPEAGPTIRGQLLRFLGDQDALVLNVSSTVSALTLVALFAAGRRLSASEQWLEKGVIMSVPLALVTALHCHNYDLLLLLPPFIALTGSTFIQKLPRLALLSLILPGTIFMMPFYNKIHYEYLLTGGKLNPFFLVLAGFCIFTLALSLRLTPSEKQKVDTSSSKKGERTA